MGENICKSYIPKSTQRTPKTIQKQEKFLKRHFSKETIPVRNHSRYSSLKNSKATTMDTTAYLTGNCYQNKTRTPNHKIASVGWQEFGEIRSLVYHEQEHKTSATTLDNIEQLLRKLKIGLSSLASRWHTPLIQALRIYGSLFREFRIDSQGYLERLCLPQPSPERNTI